MKYTNYLFAVLAAGFALLSCQNDEKLLSDVTNKNVKFTATTESYDLETRTALNSNGNVVWKKGDQMTIFTGSTINEQYEVADNSEGKTTAEIQKVNSSSFFGGQEIDDNVAVYPYNKATSIEADGDAYSISMNLPSAQSYVANSFGNGAFPMVAVTDGTSDKALKFYNLMGGLKLQLKGTCKVQAITLTGNTNEILCGPATVTAQSGTAPVTQMTGSTQKTVTLNCGGVQLNTSTATTFIIAVPAGALSSGFTVVKTDIEGKEMEKTAIASNTIVRSKMIAMPAFMVETTISSTNHNGHEYVNLGLPSGTLWATMNVGATSVTDYGDYFAWGATEPWYEPGYAQESSQSHWKTGKSAGYTWVNTPYQTANTTSWSSTKWTKYLGITTSSYKDPLATDADALKIVLDPEDDAASVNWGGSWRMPTKAEQDELRNTDNCTWTWYGSGNDEFNGIAGFKVESNISGYEGNFIFLPAAGDMDDTYLHDIATECYYWSSSLFTSFPESAYNLGFASGFVDWGNGSRYYGQSVRPVFSEDTNCGNTGVSLNKTSTSITLGSSETLTATISKNAGAVNTQVEWSSSNTAVATVDHSGRVTAVSAGIATITARTVFGGFTATCTVTATPYAFVELGLSVKWATMNVGATKSTDYGDYFAWGEVTPKPKYTWSTYKYCKGSLYTQTKYCNNSSYGYNGYTDSKTVIDSSDDAASVNWGGNWRMPTSDEQEELRITSNCTWIWYSSGNSEFNGVAGYKVTSIINGYSGNYIFLPAAGYRTGTGLCYGSYSYYWSSSLDAGDPNSAYYLYFNSGYFSAYSNHRNEGFSVRPVCQ